jgi:pimeloyl-ACP methyl ester carboxylesterase
MVDGPVREYTKATDGVSIAYQVTGAGPLDLVWCPALVFPVDLLWDAPGFARFATRLAGFSRTVWSEARGIGASAGDPLGGLVEETAVADLDAVLAAAGCERAVLIGSNHGGPTAISYAATNPGRVSALILVDTYAHYLTAPDYPWGAIDPFGERFVEVMLDRNRSVTPRWGTGATMELLAPSKAGDDEFRAWCAQVRGTAR